MDHHRSQVSSVRSDIIVAATTGSVPRKKDTPARAGDLGELRRAPKPLLIAFGDLQTHLVAGRMVLASRMVAGKAYSRIAA